MFIEPQEFNTAQELRNHYKQVRERIYAPPAPKTPPKLEKPAMAWPSAPDRAWSFAVVEPEPEPKKNIITIDKIVTEVCNRFHVREVDLKSHRRYHNVTYPRMMAFYFSRNRTASTFPMIGRIFGGRDHSTILSGCKKIDRLLNAGDERTVKAIAAIERALGV